MHPNMDDITESDSDIFGTVLADINHINRLSDDEVEDYSMGACLLLLNITPSPTSANAGSTTPPTKAPYGCSTGPSSPPPPWTPTSASTPWPASTSFPSTS